MEALNTIDVALEDGYSGRIEVYQDEHAESPREWDNLGTMICWHSRYNLGDKHNYSTPCQFQEEWNHKNAIMLPLYLYDHSGITMNTSGFQCGWDSGQVGWIYVSKEDVRKEWGVKRNIHKPLAAKIRDILRSEVKTYDDYLTGRVYGFMAYLIDPDGDETQVDSCWGYYGDDADEPNGHMIVEARDNIHSAFEDERKEHGTQPGLPFEAAGCCA